jgi:hypothetical protein
MSVSCKRASMLISESMDRALSRRERLSLGFHLLICTYCRRLRSQLRSLRRIMQSQFIAEHLRLSAEARARIHRALGTRP